MDVVNIEILEDGTTSIKTTDISETYHIAFGDAIDEIKTRLGGKVETKRNHHPFFDDKIVLRGGKIVTIGK